MIALLRLFVFGFIGLSVVYLLVSVYSRSVRRERLEKEWDAGHPGGADPQGREAHVEAGMKAYHHSLRRRLIILVYVLPLMAMSIIMYYVNAQ